MVKKAKARKKKARKLSDVFISDTADVTGKSYLVEDIKNERFTEVTKVKAKIKSTGADSTAILTSSYPYGGKPSEKLTVLRTPAAFKKRFPRISPILRKKL